LGLTCVHKFDSVYTMKITTRELRENLASYLMAVQDGEVFVVMKHGKEIAKLMPCVHNEEVRTQPETESVHIRPLVDKKAIADEIVREVENRPTPQTEVPLTQECDRCNILREKLWELYYEGEALAICKECFGGMIPPHKLEAYLKTLQRVEIIPNSHLFPPSSFDMKPRGSFDDFTPMPKPVKKKKKKK